MLFAAAFGMVGERYRWFGKISGIIVTISITIILVSFNVIPSASNPDLHVPVYDFTFTYIIPIAIPLLLFNVNIKRMIKESGRLLKAFLLGTLGVSIGVIVAAWILPMGVDTYKLAAVYSATYIGGGVNFMAVADALDFLRSPLFPAAIAIDNVFTNFFIILLFFLPGWKFMRKLIPTQTKQEDEEIADIELEPQETIKSDFDTLLMEQICICLLIAFSIATVSIWVAPILEGWLKTDVKLDIVINTIIIVSMSNIFPRFMRRLEPVAFQLGFLLLFIFLAVIGAASDVKEIIATSPSVLGFVIITLIIHLLVMLVGSRVLKVSLEELSIASAANVGGSSTSAPMATTFGMKKAITPAVLIGTLGNVIGTFIGIGIGLFLQ